jgi:hypothetical protein
MRLRWLTALLFFDADAFFAAPFLAVERFEALALDFVLLLAWGRLLDLVLLLVLGLFLALALAEEFFFAVERFEALAFDLLLVLRFFLVAGDIPDSPC